MIKFTVYHKDGRAMRHGICPEGDFAGQGEAGETMKEGHLELWVPPERAANRVKRRLAKEARANEQNGS